MTTPLPIADFTIESGHGDTCFVTAHADQGRTYLRAACIADEDTDWEQVMCLTRGMRVIRARAVLQGLAVDWVSLPM